MNKLTIFDPEPMQDPQDFVTEISNSRLFSKLDLLIGYWKISMKEQDRYLTSFSTPDGLYGFKIMPFELSNSPATLNRLMRKVLKV